MRGGSLSRLVGALLVLAAVLLLAGSALGTTYTVTSTADSGPGTLRQAILDANANAGPDQITIAPGTYTPASQLPDISDDLTIVGSGSSTTTIDGSNDATAALLVDPNLTFVASAITVTNSNSEGIAIQSGGTSSLTNVALTSNDGIGISSEGQLTLAHATISDNGDDGVFLDFFATPGSLELDNSTIADNDGNGVRIQAGTATLTGDTISNSTLNGVNSLVPVTISSSTISGSSLKGIRAARATLVDDTVVSSTGAGIDLLGNSTVTASTASGNGGDGIWSEGGTLALTNSTVAANTGGGLQADGGTVTVVNDTIAGNSGGSGGIGVNTQVNVENTVVAGNSPADCSTNAEDLGYDLESGTSCGFVALTDHQNADPLLGALQDNGGSTFTEALGSGSPALDAGNDTDCPATDQRATSRPQGSHCDIGAFELVQSGGGGGTTTTTSTTTTSTTTTTMSSAPPAPAPPNHAPVIRYLIEDGVNHQPVIDASSSFDPDGDSFSTSYHVVFGAGFFPADSYTYGPVWINPTPFGGQLSVTITETDARGLSSTITFPVQAPLQAFPLAVEVSGKLVSKSAGAGLVVGGKPDVRCTSVCVVTVPIGGVVRLQAQRIEGGQPFTGWSGACSGLGECDVSLGAPGTVVATFGSEHAPQNITPPAISDTPSAPPGNMPFSYYVSGGLFHPSYGTPAYAYVGTWDTPKPSDNELQWLLCDSGCTAISGATGKRYVPTVDEIGKKLMLSVTAVRGGVASPAALSPAGLIDNHLHTATAPGTATTDTAVVDDGGTSATIGGTFIAGSQDWTYGFKWGRGALDHYVQVGTWSQASGFTFGNIDNSSQAATTQLTGLIPGDTYEYEMVATTSSTASTWQNTTAATVVGGVRTFVAAPDSSRPAFLSVDFVPASGQEPTRLHVTVVPGAAPVVFSGTWTAGTDTGTIQTGRINAGATPASQDSFYLDLNGADPIQQGLTYTYTVVAQNGTASTVTYTGSGSVPWTAALTTFFPASISSSGAYVSGQWIGGGALFDPRFVIGGGPTVDAVWDQCTSCTAFMWANVALAPGKTYTVQAVGFTEIPTQASSCPNGLPVYATVNNARFCPGPEADGQVLRFRTPAEQPSGATFSGGTVGLSLGCATSTGCGGSFTVTTPTRADFSLGAVSQAERGLAAVGSPARQKPPPWAHKVALGKYSFHLAAGKHGKFTLSLPRAGRRYLAAHPSLKAVVVTLTERHGGRPFVMRSLVKLKR